jgi:hypothetical protein
MREFLRAKKSPQNFFKKGLDKPGQMWYIIITKGKGIRIMYEVRKYDYISGEWVYMNSYKTYSEARKAMEEMSRRYHGEYEIF